jgi:hypothetical protein
MDAGLPTPFFPGRAAHQGTPCDEGACADAVTTFSMPIVAAAPAPTPMKSRRRIDSRTGSFESFMVNLLNGQASVFLSFRNHGFLYYSIARISG